MNTDAQSPALTVRAAYQASDDAATWKPQRRAPCFAYRTPHARFRLEVEHREMAPFPFDPDSIDVRASQQEMARDFLAALGDDLSIADIAVLTEAFAAELERRAAAGPDNHRQLMRESFARLTQRALEAFAPPLVPIPRRPQV